MNGDGVVPEVLFFRSGKIPFIGIISPQIAVSAGAVRRRDDHIRIRSPGTARKCLLEFEIVVIFSGCRQRRGLLLVVERPGKRLFRIVLGDLPECNFLHLFHEFR